MNEPGRAAEEQAKAIVLDVRQWVVLDDESSDAPKPQNLEEAQVMVILPHDTEEQQEVAKGVVALLKAVAPKAVNSSVSEMTPANSVIRAANNAMLGLAEEFPELEVSDEMRAFGNLPEQTMEVSVPQSVLAALRKELTKNTAFF